MYNVSFKTYRGKKLLEEGFDTSMSSSLKDVIHELDSMLDLDNVDRIELTINTITF